MRSQLQNDEGKLSPPLVFEPRLPRTKKGYQLATLTPLHSFFKYYLMDLESKQQPVSTLMYSTLERLGWWVDVKSILRIAYSNQIEIRQILVCVMFSMI